MKGNASIFLVGAVLIFVVVVGYLLYTQDISKSWLGLGINRTPVYSTETGSVTSDKISLEVTSPADGAKLTSATTTVKGKTAPMADVFINDKETKADSNGNFSLSLSLDEGENQIVVIVNDSLGNSAEKDILVTVQTFE